MKDKGVEAAVHDGDPAAAGRKPRRTPAKGAKAQAPVGYDGGHGPNHFPIVGIGASAGGLEALEQFFSAVPPGCGMAFVIVQHLDPNHKGIMPELLQRGTRMPVEQVRDRVTVEPGHVYVIPPNKDLSLLRGALHLFDPAAPRGLRLPIDFFFRSLAEDQHEASIGVLLSGMGSDGTLGLRAIKEQAGVTLVQDPATAKFDGMPRSAIDAGLADIVAPPEALCERLMAYLQHTPQPVPATPELEDRDQSGLDKVMILLRNHTGHDFSHYKKNTLYRRIERRMRLHQLDRIAQYVRYLQENPQERGLLFRELLIGVTSFFRDPEAWLQLREQVMPTLFAARPDGGTLRAWVAGCSTGEEAYSLGILFREAVEALRPDQDFTLQVFATDLDGDAINRARQGVYPANITADVSPERLRRFFVKEETGGGYRIGKEVREMVVFAQQNLIQDPPFTKIDLLICRNLLIYLDSELQHKLLSLFHYSLTPGGVLFLGSAETASGPTELFSTLDGKWRFFRRESVGDEVRPLMTVNLPPPPQPLADGRLAPPPASLQSAVEQVLLMRFAPAAVLTTPQGDILYISGRTGKYLEPPAGRVNWNIFAMAREGLREELLTIVQQALHQGTGEPFVRHGLRIRTNGDFQTVDLSVLALHEPQVLRGTLLLVFTEVAAPLKRRGRRGPADDRSAETLEQEVQQLRETLQNTREAMQTSQEELQSSNEELQSTNEELQSTNEELTTSKEEMQSLNEELQTVNTELQSKVDDLSRVNDDMKNLLDSTEIAALFLDDGLRVRRFTSRASELIKLIPSDIGRPVTDIASKVLYPELATDVAEVLRTLVFTEKAIPVDGRRWFSVRIMPYRTLDNRIDGVVVTFLDDTRAKLLEAELNEARKELERLRGAAAAAPGKNGQD